MSRSILIVEDDVDVLDIITDALGSANSDDGDELNIRTCRDGHEAAMLCKNQKFSAIVLDLKLPNTSGYQVASNARSSSANRSTPILIVSGSLMKESFMMLKRLGSIDFLAKPFSPKDLGEKFRNLLASGAKQTEEEAPVSKPDAKVDYDPTIIKAFVASAKEVLNFYFGREPTIGTISVRDPDRKVNAFISAMIPLKGTAMNGSVAFSLGNEFVKQFIKINFGDDANLNIDEELLGSTTGEMCNQICGIANEKFSRIGYEMNLDVPHYCVGKNHVIEHAVKAKIVSVPIKIGEISCSLEFSLIRSEDDDGNTEIEFVG